MLGVLLCTVAVHRLLRCSIASRLLLRELLLGRGRRRRKPRLLKHLLLAVPLPMLGLLLLRLRLRLLWLRGRLREAPLPKVPGRLRPSERMRMLPRWCKRVLLVVLRHVTAVLLLAPKILLVVQREGDD